MSGWTGPAGWIWYAQDSMLPSRMYSTPYWHSQLDTNQQLSHWTEGSLNRMGTIPELETQPNTAD